MGLPPAPLALPDSRRTEYNTWRSGAGASDWIAERRPFAVARRRPVMQVEKRARRRRERLHLACQSPAS